MSCRVDASFFEPLGFDFSSYRRRSPIVATWNSLKVDAKADQGPPDMLGPGFDP